MVKIKVRLRIDVPREIIWEVISKVENDLYFWKGITSTRTISEGGNELVREVVLGCDILCTQKITMWPMEKIQVKWVEGVIRGTREIALVSLGGATLVEVQMNYEFPGLVSSDSKRLAKLFQNEAELAVDLIKRMVEQFESSSPLMIGKGWEN
ncbi:MAG: hypothetical protein KGI33_07855 [Thaumarchaeota archaeon]|nr:hypothetical protein [Nitrososphaerota archaeon]